MDFHPRAVSLAVMCRHSLFCSLPWQAEFVNTGRGRQASETNRKSHGLRGLAPGSRVNSGGDTDCVIWRGNKQKSTKSQMKYLRHDTGCKSYMGRVQREVMWDVAGSRGRDRANITQHTWGAVTKRASCHGDRVLQHPRTPRTRKCHFYLAATQEHQR